MTSQRLRPARHVLHAATLLVTFASGAVYAQNDAQIREDIRFARGVAEEWGFVGRILVLSLYLAMLLWGLWIATKSKDGFGALLAVGLVGTLFWPAAINIATAPATCGVAIEVPLIALYPLGSAMNGSPVTGTVLMMLEPGAARSTDVRPKLEKPDRLSLRSVDATAMMPGKS